MGDAVEIIGQGAGLHIVVRVPQKISEIELIERAKENGIRVYPISNYYITNLESSPMIMMGFGGLSPESTYAGMDSTCLSAS